MTAESDSITPSRASLAELIDTGDMEGLKAHINSRSPAETICSVLRLPGEKQRRLFVLMDAPETAEIFKQMPETGAAKIIAGLPAPQAATIVNDMQSFQQANLLGQLKQAGAEAILDEMAPEHAAYIRQQMSYPENTAGGLMVPEYLSYPEQMPVRDVVEDFRRNVDKYSGYYVQYAYIVSDSGMLRGVLRMRDLVLSQKEKPIRSIMIADPLKVDVATPLSELQSLFNQHAFYGIPVVDDRGVLRGVVRRASVMEAAGKNSNKLFLKFAGIIGGEELRSTPFFTRSSRRLSWLSINIVLNIIAASVIAFYQDTLEKAITLAVFLPIISDMSGCSGNQAVAVSIRELTLGTVRPRELAYVLGKESIIGCINGLVLGCLLGAAALLWKGNPYLGLVVGAALAANTLLAVCIGGLIPLVLRSMKTDPALASGPLLTTITDMCGFFFVLSFATAVLSKLSS
ncbi:magnesium transporter [Thermodesulfobacteriota bacterium]